MSCMEKYLSHIKEKKTVVKMFLTSGTMLTGLITGFDEDSIVIGKCLAFREQVTSITPKE